jgi:hypothetical protein
MPMKFFPKSLLIIFLIGFFTCFVVYLYEHTKGAYINVGFNNGRIYEKERILEDIVKLSGELPDCKKYSREDLRRELITVKTRSLFVLKVDAATFEFCEFR